MKLSEAIELKVGDRVNYHSIIGGEITLRNREIRAIEFSGILEDISYGKVWLRGKAGFVSTEALSLMQQSQIKEKEK